jgi:EpsI family protein
MTRRIVILTICLVVAGSGRAWLQAMPDVDAASLSTLPMSFDGWEGTRAADFDPSVLGILRADDYINRVYRQGQIGVGLYVGYYRSQKSGAAIHSPLNCLPGSGWQPQEMRRVPFGARGAVRQVLVQKGDERVLVLYWYESLRRVEGDEYRSKAYLMWDAITARRSDAALVRVVMPLPPDADEGATTEAAYRFAATAEPKIAQLLFSGKDSSR